MRTGKNKTVAESPSELEPLTHYGLKNEGRISIEQYNRELDEAEAEIDRGEYITQEELKNQMKGW